MALQPTPHLSFEDWLEGERAALLALAEVYDRIDFAVVGLS
ncbi:hypothetical protein [Halochromatium salexigens]|nr:hypothetical protein [Halochromatium salexigens]